MPWLFSENTCYETPEIIALPIVAGDADYLRWRDSSVPSGWHDAD